ncbi:Predicted lipase [Phaffia rhodozyma]|uniref:Predicted lipase n=1 Tax=Phaffia rhodozyma TaxID=264483 RepID=A0A0F7SKD9_PHARH|nr:Predicted lipase [Phaffia rhodozyma]
MYSYLIPSLLLSTTAFAYPVIPTLGLGLPDFARLAKITSINHCQVEPTLFLSDEKHGYLTYIEPSYMDLFLDKVVSSESTEPVSLQSTEFFEDLPKDIRVDPLAKEIFEESAEELMNEVRNELANSKHIKKIELVGHGFGGSIALLHALHIQMSLEDLSIPIEVTMFGSPRVGNQPFVEHVMDQLATFSNRIHLVSSPTDPVPHLPPRGALKTGYRDIPFTHMWDINHDGKVVYKHSTLSVKNFLNLSSSTRGEDLSDMRLASHWASVEGVTFERCLE